MSLITWLWRAWLSLMIVLLFSAMACFASSTILSLELTTPEEHEAFAFLVDNMPERDRELPRSYLLSHVQYALKARSSTAWAQKVPWDIFLNNVVPYASLNENRDDWRAVFFDTHLPLVLDARTIEEAALTLSLKVWSLWNLSFVAGQTPMTMSPFQTLRGHNASCTGLSIFLVDTCRSVGIPARVTGTPEWNTKSGGNHDWVEIWFNSAWNFMDSFDGTAFNQTWFFPYPVKNQRPRSGNHSVYATSWKKTKSNMTFPMSWDFTDHSVNAEDVTQTYLDLHNSNTRKKEGAFPFADQ